MNKYSLTIGALCYASAQQSYYRPKPIANGQFNYIQNMINREIHYTRVTLKDGLLTGQSFRGFEPCPPFEEGSGIEILQGTYSVNGEAMKNPDPEKWKFPNSRKTHNVFWATEEGTEGTDDYKQYYYSGVLEATPDASSLKVISYGEVFGASSYEDQDSFTWELPKCTEEEISDATIAEMPLCYPSGYCPETRDGNTCGAMVVDGKRIEGCVPVDQCSSEETTLPDGRKSLISCERSTPATYPAAAPISNGKRDYRIDIPIPADKEEARLMPSYNELTFTDGVITGKHYIYKDKQPEARGEYNDALQKAWTACRQKTDECVEICPNADTTGYTEIEGTYSVNGETMENPDPKNWLFAQPNHNIFFTIIQPQWGTREYFSGVFDTDINPQTPIETSYFNYGSTQLPFKMQLPTCTDAQIVANIDAFIVGVAKNIDACDADGTCPLNEDGEVMTCGTNVFPGANEEELDNRIEGCVQAALCGKGMPTDEANPEGLVLEDGRKMYFQCEEGLRLFASAAAVFISVAYTI